MVFYIKKNPLSIYQRTNKRVNCHQNITCGIVYFSPLSNIKSHVELALFNSQRFSYRLTTTTAPCITTISNAWLPPLISTFNDHIIIFNQPHSMYKPSPSPLSLSLSLQPQMQIVGKLQYCNRSFKRLRINWVVICSLI